jgi:hypothetical protein
MIGTHRHRGGGIWTCALNAYGGYARGMCILFHGCMGYLGDHIICMDATWCDGHKIDGILV